VINIKRALSHARGFVRLRRRSLLLAAIALYITGPGVVPVWLMPSAVERRYVCPDGKFFTSRVCTGISYGSDLQYRASWQAYEELVRHDEWAVGLRLHLSTPSVRLFRVEVGSDGIDVLGFGVCESSAAVCDGLLRDAPRLHPFAR